MTWAFNNNIARLMNNGTSVIPADPYRCYPGLVNIASNVKPGIKTLYVTVAGLQQSNPTTMQVFTQLYVRSRTTGYGAMLTEA
jgi:hypothetical protein